MPLHIDLTADVVHSEYDPAYYGIVEVCEQPFRCPNMPGKLRGDM
jgi:hypothetical protein